MKKTNPSNTPTPKKARIMDNNDVTCSFSRYYYTDNQRLEQSLDVYRPSALLEDDENVQPPPPAVPDETTTSRGGPVVVILVMGSGWLGHAPWIYTMTNWWNSSGPKTVSQLGYTCISVRHSGAFFQIPKLETNASWWKILIILWIALAYRVVSLFGSTLSSASATTATTTSSSDCIWFIGMSFAVILFYACLRWQAKGAAQSVDEMTRDIDKALWYIRNHLGFDHRYRLVLGGYSSGAHVVATYMASKLSSSSNPSNQLEASATRSQSTGPIDPVDRDLDHIHGILYLSGVLSVGNCAAMNLITLAVFGKWADQVYSPFRDSILERSGSKKMKHLLVACRKEVFGLPWFDSAFCSWEYAQWLNDTCDIPAQCLLVDSNHWSVLSSRNLANALNEGIPWIFDCGNDEDAAKKAGGTNELAAGASSPLLLRTSTSTSLGTD